MLTGILAGLAAGALWGLVFVAPRMVSGFAGIDLTAGRFVVYGLVSVVVLAVSARRARKPTLAQAWGALWLSVLGFTGYYWILVLSIRDAGTAMPALIVGTIPIWVMLLGKPQGLRWAALLPGLLLALTLGTPLPQLMAQPGWPLFALIVVAIGFGSSWLATILWNIASQKLSASLCGQLIVSETLFALLYSFLWDHRWPTLAQWAAAALFTAGILASIKAHQ